MWTNPRHTAFRISREKKLEERKKKLFCQNAFGPKQKHLFLFVDFFFGLYTLNKKGLPYCLTTLVICAGKLKALAVCGWRLNVV